ncbi:MAG: hypothetical protein LBU73_08995 [Helicobacteraceae bacterium]|jgi:hypothetical protein|nr:hypothetical protein [Helicobacteraceae bacterium]
MINIESYIIKDKKIKIADIDNIDKDLFVNVKDYKLLNAKNLDYDYLEGSIVVNYNGQEYLELKDWDLIEQLWGYFVIAIKDLKQKDTVAFQFPDCPFAISIEKKRHNRLIVLFHDKRMNIDLAEFVFGILNAAESFYENLKQLFVAREWEINEEIENIQNIKNLWSVK